MTRKRLLLLLLPLLVLPLGLGAAWLAMPREVPVAPLPAGTRIDRLLVDKSERTLTGFSGDRQVLRYTAVRLGDAPDGHKQFEGDERTPEGSYRISLKNPASSYVLSLKIDYPNSADEGFATARRRSPGGDIFIHGQPNAWPGPALAYDWTDGCIALTNDQMRQLYSAVDVGATITIRP